jgi:hypothetical protein
MKTSIIIMAGLIALSCSNKPEQEDHLNLKDKLGGKWIAAAFSGELHEEWTLHNTGWMIQEGYYIENNDTSYSAKTRIEKVDNDIILFSVIKNSNPKIFKATSITDKEIIFENDDYRNPFQVKYEFLSKSSYRRTIRGYEQDSLVTYEFNFKRLD